MNSVPADLTSRDLWSESLERSQARRRRAGVVPGYSALELLPAEPRDLTDPEVWVRSGWRSRARREAAAHKSEMLAPSPRGLSLAALLAVTGVPGRGRDLRRPGRQRRHRGPGQDGGRLARQRRQRPAARHRRLRRRRVRPPDPEGPQGLPAQPRAHGRRHRRPADPRRGWAWAPARCSSAAARRAPPACAPPARWPPAAAASRRSSARIGVSADGVFGPQTEAALKRWQGSHGLEADGIAGPMTRAKAGLGPGPVLKRKSARSAGGGGGDSRVAGVIAAANRIASTPYKYGGGHGSFNDSGYDCSGSVSYALHGGGLIERPAGVERAHELRRPRPGQADHGLRQLRPRLHGHRRAPVRHQRAQPDRQPLDVGVALERRATWRGTRSACRTPPRHTTAASPPAPRARCTRATCAPRWWPGCVRARWARGSC